MVGRGGARVRPSRHPPGRARGSGRGARSLTAFQRVAIVLGINVRRPKRTGRLPDFRLLRAAKASGLTPPRVWVRIRFDRAAFGDRPLALYAETARDSVPGDSKALISPPWRRS